MLRHIYFAVLALVFTSYCQQLLAYPHCGEQIVDDSYYDIDKIRYDLSKAQQEQLNDVIEKLEGQWRGELNIIECKGTIKSPLKIIDTSAAKLSIKAHSKRRLKLHADLDFRQQDKKVLYNRKIFERRYIGDFTANGPDILIVTEKSYRQHRFSLGTTLIETIYKIMFIENKLHLDIITFNNGFFESEERWRLTHW
jgi:hypothetical protein